MTPDLVVVGAGTMGAWTALVAQRAGMQVTLVDAYGAGHPRASSGDETRIIRAAHAADPFYARWSQLARSEWIRLGEDCGEALFLPSGMLWFAHRDDGWESASQRTLTGLGMAVERIPADDVAVRWPQIATEDLTFALHEPDAGVLMARRGIAAVARAFQREGGRLALGWAEPGMARGRRLIDVHLNDGARLAAGSFVFAAGPWLPRIFPVLLGDLIRVTRQDLYYVGPAAGDGRFRPQSQPAWVDYDHGYYGIPDVEGRGFKVAPDADGPPFDPTADDRVTSPATAALMRDYLALRFPALASGPIVETRVCQYESTPDTHFIIDRHPDLENAWVVGGGSGHAFKHGPVIGRHVATLVGADGGGPVGMVVPAPPDDRFSVTRPRPAQAHLRTGGASGARARTFDD